jgi:hypothetical protein
MSIFKKLIKLTLDVVETPIAVVKDVVTLGGAINDKNQSYTSDKVEDITDDYQRLKNELDK